MDVPDGDDSRGPAPGDAARTVEVARAGVLLARVAIARLNHLAHPRGGWSDFWLEPGCSTSWVTAYTAAALADAAEAGGVSGGQRAVADALVRSAADRLLATQRDGTWGWAPGLRPDADSTAWAVRVLVAAGRVVPDRSWTFLDRHLGPAGAATYTDRATGVWTDPMPEVTAVVLDALADRLPAADLEVRWAGLLAAGPEWTSHWWSGSDHPSALVLDAWRRREARSALAAPDLAAARAPDARLRAATRASAPASAPARPTSRPPAVTLPSPDLVSQDGVEARVAHEVPEGGGPSWAPSGVCARADLLWRTSLLGRPDPDAARAILDEQLAGGGWAGDAQVVVPAQSGDGSARRSVDARGVFTTATVLHAAVAVLRGLPAEDLDGALGRIADREAGPGSGWGTPLPGPGQPDGPEIGSTGGSGRGSQRGSEPGHPPVLRTGSDGRSGPPRDRRWDVVIARAAHVQGVPPERALEVFRALTRESLTARSPWPAPQLSALASGQPVELSAGTASGLRFTCEVGDPRLAPPARLGSGLVAVERTAQLLGMGEAWAGRRGQLLGVLADPELPVPEGCRFWLWAGVDLPATGPAVLKAYLSLHAGDVDDWRARLHRALRMLPPGGSIWPALACLRGAGWCHEVGIGERPGGHWGLKVYFELDRWRPDLLAELITTCDLPTSVAELTPDIPGVVRAAHRGRRRAGIALRVDPVTGDVIEVTTTVAVPPPLVGNDVLADRIAAWLAQRGQDPSPLRATIAAVEPDWAGADPSERMLGLITLSGGRRGASATVYVRPRPAGLDSALTPTPALVDS